MKVDNNHLFNLLKPGSINQNIPVSGAAVKKPVKTFSIPESEPSKKVDFPKKVEFPKQAEDLSKLLSGEEKKLFELLFSKKETISTSSPAKSYSVQTKHTEIRNKPDSGILGGRLDIQG